MAAAYAAGREAAFAASHDVDALLAAGYGDGGFEHAGSEFALVPEPPPGDEDRRTDWAVGYAHALEDLGEALRVLAGTARPLR